MVRTAAAGIEPFLYYYAHPADYQADRYAAGKVLWSADDHYLDMEAGDFAQGRGRGLPVTQYFCTDDLSPGVGHWPR